MSACLLAGALMFGMSNRAHSQTDMELAEYYFNEGSYPQAKLYLEGIWKKNKTNAVYTMYYATLLALDDFETCLLYTSDAADE